MTKEELEKEAEEYVCKRNPLVTKEWFIDALKKYDKGEKVKYLKDCEIAEYEAYLAGAEPRENRIVELEKENAELKDYAIQLKTETAKRDTELIKQLLELDKERIKAKELLRDVLPYIDLTDCEKMKNQWNCENNNGYCVSSICPCDKWKLRR